MFWSDCYGEGYIIGIFLRICCLCTWWEFLWEYNSWRTSDSPETIILGFPRLSSFRQWAWVVQGFSSHFSPIVTVEWWNSELWSFSVCNAFLNFTFWLGLRWWLNGKESACQCRRCGFDPWVGKIPWRRKWQPTSVFLPGKAHGQGSLVGYSLWVTKS